MQDSVQVEDADTKSTFYNLTSSIETCRETMANISYEQSVFLRQDGELVKKYFMVEITPLLVEENKLSAGHARALVPLSPSLQESAANAILTGGLSVRQTEALVKRLSAEKKEPKKKQADAVDYLAEAQNELKAKLCRGVKIVSGRKKGRIELEYYGLDDLNDLLDALALIKINKAKEGPQA